MYILCLFCIYSTTIKHFKTSHFLQNLKSDNFHRNRETKFESKQKNEPKNIEPQPKGKNNKNQSCKDWKFIFIVSRHVAQHSTQAKRWQWKILWLRVFVSILLANNSRLKSLKLNNVVELTLRMTWKKIIINDCIWLILFRYYYLVVIFFFTFIHLGIYLLYV